MMINWKEEIVIPVIKIEQSKKDKKERILAILKNDSRIKITEISRLTKIPITTVWSILKDIQKEYHYTIVKRKEEN